MSAKPLSFRHEVIDADPPGAHHDITLIADLTGDGRNDIVIGGKRPGGANDVNLFWYENPTWRRHDMAHAPELEAGGVVVDITGNGRPDIVAGQQWDGTDLHWFECPEDPTRPWTKRVIENRFRKYHDQAVGDVDGDGEPEIVFISQQTGVLAYYDIPSDPRVAPWPQECFHVIAEGFDREIEGLAIVDVDGDGVMEIVAGPNVFRPVPKPVPSWKREPIAGTEDFHLTRVAVADLFGEGRLDIILAEGESHPGRLAVCSAPDWKPRVLKDDLFHPHSLEIADFDGDGRLDIFVGEMGLGRNDNPRLFIFRNTGEGEFEECVISEGVPTHEAKVGDLTGNGRPDIVGKPYDPERHIDVWFNET